ncbi:MAG: hypothetical protein Q7R41_01310 [Phycisphaerales bacterium]|nr:hypothetical protein [Phycisphaerales bacterium]
MNTNLVSEKALYVSDYVAAHTKFENQLRGTIELLREELRVVNESINRLQSTPGDVSPEDQTLLTTIHTRSAKATDLAKRVASLAAPVIPAWNAYGEWTGGYLATDQTRIPDGTLFGSRFPSVHGRPAFVAE